jgi:hypothetical protein
MQARERDRANRPDAGHSRIRHRFFDNVGVSSFTAGAAPLRPLELPAQSTSCYLKHNSQVLKHNSRE